MEHPHRPARYNPIHRNEDMGAHRSDLNAISIGGRDMKLSITVNKFRLARTFTISRGVMSDAKVLNVKIEADGAVGIGECVPQARYGETLESVTQQIKAVPLPITRSELQEAIPAGAARNAIDCALWDLEAKSKGTPVWKLAGLPRPRPEITAYTLSLGTPKIMQVQAAKHAHRPLLKIKLGAEGDIARLEAIRAGAPKSRIIVDANEGWTIEGLHELAPFLVKLGVEMVEQPLPAEEDGALLNLDYPLTICADESCHDRASLPKLNGKYGMVNIKLDKTGGLTEALALRHASQANGYQVMVGCGIGSSLAMAPAILVAQGAAVTDLDGPLLLAEDRANALKYDSAGVHPPSASLWG